MTRINFAQVALPLLLPFIVRSPLQLQLDRSVHLTLKPREDGTGSGRPGARGVCSRAGPLNCGLIAARTYVMGPSECKPMQSILFVPFQSPFSTHSRCESAFALLLADRLFINKPALTCPSVPTVCLSHCACLYSFAPLYYLFLIVVLSLSLVSFYLQVSAHRIRLKGIATPSRRNAQPPVHTRLMTVAGRELIIG